MFSSVRSSYTEVRSGCDHWCNWKAYWINFRTNPMSLNIDNWHFSAQVSIYIHMYNRNFLPISENIYRKMHSLSVLSYQAFHFFTANEVQYTQLNTRVYFSRDYIFCRGDRYVLAYICAKNLNLIIWHLLHMCYPNKNRFILIFSLLTYCANLCLQFANLCLQFRVIIFRQIFDSALPWAVCCAGVLFI